MHEKDQLLLNLCCFIYRSRGIFFYLIYIGGADFRRKTSPPSCAAKKRVSYLCNTFPNKKECGGGERALFPIPRSSITDPVQPPRKRRVVIATLVLTGVESGISFRDIYRGLAITMHYP
jgi:hypothetical protein